MLLTLPSQATTFAGTPYYMSPESLQGQAYSTASDVWALGCVLHEVLTLNRTFDGDNLMGVMFKVRARARAIAAGVLMHTPPKDLRGTPASSACAIQRGPQGPRSVPVGEGPC